jgi:hypothetical protein
MAERAGVVLLVTVLGPFGRLIGTLYVLSSCTTDGQIIAPPSCFCLPAQFY